MKNNILHSVWALFRYITVFRVENTGELLTALYCFRRFNEDVNLNHLLWSIVSATGINYILTKQEL